MIHFKPAVSETGPSTPAPSGRAVNGRTAHSDTRPNAGMLGSKGSTATSGRGATSLENDQTTNAQYLNQQQQKTIVPGDQNGAPEISSKSASDAQSDEPRKPTDEFQDLLARVLEEDRPAPKTASIARPVAKPAGAVATRDASMKAKPENSVVQIPTIQEKVAVLPFALNFALPVPGSQNTVGKSEGAAREESAVLGVSNNTENTLEKLKPEIAGPQAFTAQIHVDAGAPEKAADKSQTAGLRNANAVTPGQVAGPARFEADVKEAIATASEIKAYTESAPSARPGTTHDVISGAAIEPTAPLEKTTAPAEPVRDIAFQIPGARGVEVRVSERQGELKVDVRSGDAALTQDLRGNLRELVNGLERKGFSAEVSHPGAEVATAARPGDAGLSKDHSHGQDSGEGSNGDAGRQQQGNRQRRERDAEKAIDLTSPKTRAAAWATAFFSKIETK